MFPGKQDLGVVDPGLLFRPETDTARMVDEAIGQMKVAPAGLFGTLAPVVFLAIAPAESFQVEVTDLPQAIAAQVHTAAHPRGHIDDVPGTELAGKTRVQLGDRQAEQQGIFPAEIRKTADGRVVRKGGDARCFAVVISGLAHPLQPVVGHLDVAVEQQYVALDIVLHAAVDGGHKTQVLLVLEQHQV